MTGKPPFSEHRTDLAVIVALTKGLQPQRPPASSTDQNSFTDRVWALAERCWSSDAVKRPTTFNCMIELEQCAAELSQGFFEEEDYSATSNTSSDSGSSSDSDSTIVSQSDHEGIVNIDFSCFRY